MPTSYLDEWLKRRRGQNVGFDTGGGPPDPGTDPTPRPGEEQPGPDGGPQQPPPHGGGGAGWTQDLINFLQSIGYQRYTETPGFGTDEAKPDKSFDYWAVANRGNVPHEFEFYTDPRWGFTIGDWNDATRGTQGAWDAFFAKYGNAVPESVRRANRGHAGAGDGPGIGDGLGMGLHNPPANSVWNLWGSAGLNPNRRLALRAAQALNYPLSSGHPRNIGPPTRRDDGLAIAPPPTSTLPPRNHPGLPGIHPRRDPHTGEIIYW